MLGGWAYAGGKLAWSTLIGWTIMDLCKKLIIQLPS